MQFYREAPFSYRVVVIVGVILAIPAVDLFQRFSRYRAEYANLTNRQQREQQLHQNTLGQYLQVQKLKEQINGIERQISISDRVIDEVVDFDAFIRTLSDVSLITGAKVAELRPVQLQSDGEPHDIVLDVRLHGSFKRIAWFMEEVIGMKKMLNVESVRLEGADLAAKDEAEELELMDNSKDAARPIAAVARVRLYRPM